MSELAWVYIGVILCMRVVQSVFSKRAAVSIPQTGRGYVKHCAYRQAVAFAIAVTVLLVECWITSAPLKEIGATALYAAGCGLSLFVSVLCELYAISHGTLVLSSLFSTAGLLVPTIASAIFYRETLTLWHILAIGGLFLSLWLLIGDKQKGDKRISWKTVLALCGVMLAEGGTMLCQKVFGMNVLNGNVSLFTAIQFLVAALLAIAAIPFLRPSANAAPEEERLSGRSYLYGFLLAAAVLVISQFATLTTPLVPAVVLFSLINGGATLISAIVGSVFYGEKLTARSTLGLLVGITALIFLKV